MLKIRKFIDYWLYVPPIAELEKPIGLFKIKYMDIMPFILWVKVIALPYYIASYLDGINKR
jgi:hypothetical protein